MKRRPFYPGVEEAMREAEKSSRNAARDSKPELLETAGGIAPNYDAFPNWDVESVLAWCNMD